MAALETAAPETRTTGARTPRGIALGADGALALGFTAVLLVFTGPLEGNSLSSLLGSLTFVAIVGALFYAALRLEKHGTATILCLFALAYGFRLATYLENGVVRAAAEVQASRVQEAAVVLVMFLGVASFAALVELPFARHPASKPSLATVHGALAFAALTGIDAVRSGTWSYWYGSETTPPALGGFRFELFYLPALFCAAGVLGSAPLGRLWKLGAALGLSLPIFLLQSRRLMIACFVVVLVTNARTWFQPRRKLGLAAGGVLLTLVLTAILASANWRKERDASDPIEHFRQTASEAVSAPAFDAKDFEDRLTYLWIDALSLELAGYAPFGFAEVATAAAENATPSMLYPGKSESTPHTCEEIYAAAGLAQDLPCTPITDALLVGGVLGVLFVGMIWGLQLAWCDAALRRGSPIGYLVLSSLIAVETGAFPIFHGLRTVLIGTPLILAGSFVSTWLARRRGRPEALTAAAGSSPASSSPASNAETPEPP